MTNIVKDRYYNLGGLPQIIKGYEMCEINRAEIARLIGVTRETVRLDFLRYLGRDEYERLRVRRKQNIEEKRRLKEKESYIHLNALNAKRFLNKQLPTLDEFKAQEATIFLDVLNRAEKAGVRYEVVIKKGKPLHLLLPTGKKVRILVANLNQSLSEHKFGLHRFDVRRSITSYAFSVYALREAGEGPISIYIFNTREISQLRSLNLRFKWFNRKSKYDYALNRWSIIKSG